MLVRCAENKSQETGPNIQGRAAGRLLISEQRLQNLGYRTLENGGL